MTDYTMTVGLEIHAEVKTKSKMFCGCVNSGEQSAPNTHTCPICLGHPGTLPTINKEAVRKVLLVGLAVGSDLADFTEFDRKNYFYPDIPKGYQISQYKFPLVSGGQLAGVNLTRIHLEEDTARSSHEDRITKYELRSTNDNNPNTRASSFVTPASSLVDYNRAGVPLMELVTEPVIKSSEQAMNFAKELQLLLQYLSVSDANMEKGEMRVEVNISVSKDKTFGTKVEVKNINSFKAAGKAIDFEFTRQTDLLERGEKVVQETRGWDENKNITFSQRAKESAHDYRYFPEPDLPKILVSEVPEFSRPELNKLLVELPQEKRERYKKDFELKDLDIETFINNKEADVFFQAVASSLDETNIAVVSLASNYITSDLIGLSKTAGLEFTVGQIKTESFVELIKMISKSELSSRGAKDILKIMFDQGGDPEVIAKEKGLIQKNDPEEIKKIMGEVIANNPESVSEYKKGKESLLQFFVGQGMKAMKRAGNPEMLKNVALELLQKK